MFLLNLRNLRIAHLWESTWWSQHYWLGIRPSKGRMPYILCFFFRILSKFMNRWKLMPSFLTPTNMISFRKSRLNMNRTAKCTFLTIFILIILFSIRYFPNSLSSSHNFMMILHHNLILLYLLLKILIDNWLDSFFFMIFKDINSF